MTTKELLIRKFKLMEEELEFLKHFYNEASYYMGPADGDIYDEIKRNYGKPLPVGYELDIEEE